ncbi:MAG: hypothetical protein PHO83_03810 [Geobacteraceae bacterium]|nr:hypothetical protein [Geobacteraceae bacterium]
MKNWLLNKVLGWIGKKLDGYKTKIGGVGLILIGAAGMIGRVFPDQGLPEMDVDSAVASIAAGVAALGLGHKAEKTRAAIAKTIPPEVVIENSIAKAQPMEAQPVRKWDGKAPGQFP